MYLAVQRVQSVRGTIGINAALYSHRDGDLRPGFWEHPDIAHVADDVPGVRTGVERVEVAPGGNRVLSYLDIAAPEGTAETSIAGALTAGREEALRAGSFSLVRGSVAVRFSTNLERSTDSAQELETLGARGLALYKDQVPPAWAALAPVTIHVGHTDEGWIFQLSLDDAPRVHALHGPKDVIARISIAFDIADDFRKVYGDLYPHVAQWVTSLPRENLLELGGVRFVEAGQTVWEWPRKM